MADEQVAEFAVTVSRGKTWMPGRLTKIPEGEIEAALGELLSNEAFRRAPRATQLLRFMVRRVASDAMQGINATTIEAAAIAAEVFGRTAQSFDPSIDPIVRVQVGRLRHKLSKYYASSAGRSRLLFAIPSGSYTPTITLRHSALPRSDAEPIQFAGIRTIGMAECRKFGRGFNEQLIYELYRVFGIRFALGTDASRGLRRRLEGSLRVEQRQARVSLRLIETTSGYIRWARQFDCHGDCSIRQQEELAIAICEALKTQV